MDVSDDQYVPTNPQDQYNHDLCTLPLLYLQTPMAEAEDIADKEPEIYRGAPVSLQLVSRPFEDEKVC